MKKRLERRSLLLLFLLLIFCVAASIQINEKAKKNRLNLKTGSTEEFRKLGMEEAFFQVLAKTDHEKRGRLYAIYFLENSLFPQDNEKELFEKWSEKEEWKSFEKICTALWNDIRYFPVPESPKHPQYQVSFVDSWMGERTYGGKRGHEGCDLMASKDIPVPISSQFSVSDLLSLDFALLTLRSAILIFSFQALNEAFDRLVSSSYTPYSASTDDLSTW